jgi:hypothetical protein
MPKLLIIILTVCILGAGVGITVMQQMGFGPFSEAHDPTAAGKKELVVPFYVTMEPLVIPIFQGNVVAKTLRLHVELETREANVPIVKKQMPRLEDAYIQNLFTFVPRLLRKNKNLDLEFLSRHMMIVGERAIGKDVIVAVVIKLNKDKKSFLPWESTVKKGKNKNNSY